MDIFNSQWLLNMLAKSSTMPQGRILSLFDILEDWLNAPDIQVKLAINGSHSAPLIAYITTQAAASGAVNPTILAEHIVLIARNAAQQEIDHPGSGSLVHAKKAAHALILAQTQREWPSLKVSQRPVIYGIAASFLVIGIAITWLPARLSSEHQAISANNIVNATLTTASLNETKLSAQDAVTMYAKFEQMRSGTCQFPEALAIPDKDKAVYIESVVGGKLPTDLADLSVANAYLEKVRCNYTPMLMANSR